MPLEIEVHQMPSTSSFSRRRLLELLGGAGMGGLAGCQSDQTNGETQTDGSKLLTQADGEARTDRAETSTPDVGEEQSVKPGEQTWPQFQYDTHNSGKHPDSFGPKYSLIPRWSYQTGSRVRLSRHGNLVYSVPDGGSLTALNIETGDIQWTVDRLARYPPIPIGQDLYWGTGQGLIVIDSESGSLQEKIELELISSSPLSGLNGVLFWTNENQRIVAFDTESKSVRWIYDEIEGILGGVYPTSDSVYAGGDGDGKLHAIDPTDGSQQWTFLVVVTGYHERQLVVVTSSTLVTTVVGSTLLIPCRGKNAGKSMLVLSIVNRSLMTNSSMLVTVNSPAVGLPHTIGSPGSGFGM